MAAGKCATLLVAVKFLQSADVPFALVHESALVGWGIDNNAFLEAIDVLLFEPGAFQVLGALEPWKVGSFVEMEIGGVPTRLWSRSSLGLSGAVEVTSCARYGCEALAPELVLQKLPYSPDASVLAEQRARLASIVYANRLTDSELALVARYVRGD